MIARCPHAAHPWRNTTKSLVAQQTRAASRATMVYVHHRQKVCVVAEMYIVVEGEFAGAKGCHSRRELDKSILPVDAHHICPHAAPLAPPDSFQELEHSLWVCC